MGYTHYWERPRVLPREQFTVASIDCRRLCLALQIPLGHADGLGEAMFNVARICLNGHKNRGQRLSRQQAPGLVWSQEQAHGVAMIGAWAAGLAASARVLGPNGDGSYEPFQVDCIEPPRDPHDPSSNDWRLNFCKTNYRPYDLCVQGCLIVLSHHLGVEHFRVSSDGASRDWNDARDACQHVLGYGIDWGEGNFTPSPSPNPSAL